MTKKKFLIPMIALAVLVIVGAVMAARGARAKITPEGLFLTWIDEQRNEDGSERVIFYRDSDDVVRAAYELHTRPDGSTYAYHYVVVTTKAACMRQSNCFIESDYSLYAARRSYNDLKYAVPARTLNAKK